MSKLLVSNQGTQVIVLGMKVMYVPQSSYNRIWQVKLQSHFHWNKLPNDFKKINTLKGLRNVYINRQLIIYVVLVSNAIF